MSNPRKGERSGPVSRDTAPERARDALAAAAGVSPATAARTQAVAKAKPELLDKVAAGEVPLSQAHRLVRKEQLAQRMTELPAGKYRVIYADPPWRYNDQRDGLGESNYGDREAYGGAAGADHTAAAGQYPPMETSAICELGVRALAATDAVLFCWATFPLLEHALRVVAAWGFKYKTAIVWDKRRRNLGHYHNASAELLLVATRGAGAPDITKGLPDQVQVIDRGEHSAKPEAFREIIDKLYVTGPRIELFRRGEAPPGWTVWGNEAQS